MERRTKEVYMPCNPPKATAQGSSRIMKRRDGTQFIGKSSTSKAAAASHDLMVLLSPHVPKSPYTGPIELVIVWAYPWRKSEPKKNRVKGWKYCTTRPDCDNILKLLLDTMTRLGFWKDDSEVSCVTISRCWSDFPGIAMMTKELED